MTLPVLVVGRPIRVLAVWLLTKSHNVEVNTTSVGDLKSTQERPESSILRALLSRKVSHNASMGIRNMAEFLYLLP